MAKYEIALPDTEVESVILTVRGRKVILDSELAAKLSQLERRLTERGGHEQQGENHCNGREKHPHRGHS